MRVKDENGVGMIHRVELESQWNPDKLWSWDTER